MTDEQFQIGRKYIQNLSKEESLSILKETLEQSNIEYIEIKENGKTIISLNNNNNKVNYIKLFITNFINGCCHFIKNFKFYSKGDR